MITDKDIQDMIEYIEKVLNENLKAEPKYREMYLNICSIGKHNFLSKKQKDVLVIAYNKLFDRFER